MFIPQGLAPVFPSPALMASVPELPLDVPAAPAAPSADEMPAVVMRTRPPVAVHCAAAPPARIERPRPVEVEGCAADAESVEGTESGRVVVRATFEAVRLADAVAVLEGRLAEATAALAETREERDALEDRLGAMHAESRRPSIMARIGAFIGRVAFNADRRPVCL